MDQRRSSNGSGSAFDGFGVYCRGRARPDRSAGRAVPWRLKLPIPYRAHGALQNLRVKEVPWVDNTHYRWMAWSPCVRRGASFPKKTAEGRWRSLARLLARASGGEMEKESSDDDDKD